MQFTIAVKVTDKLLEKSRKPFIYPVGVVVDLAHRHEMVSQFVRCRSETRGQIHDNGIFLETKIAAVWGVILKPILKIVTVGSRASKQEHFQSLFLIDWEVLSFEVSIKFIKKIGIKICLFVGQIGVNMKILARYAVAQRSRDGQGARFAPEEDAQD